MKKITILLILIIGAITIFAQSPQAFKYQAVVRNNSGEIQPNKPVSFQISIHDSVPDGIIEYQETFATTTNDFGLVNLEIGTGTTSDDFTLIDWADGPKYLEIEIDPDGGTSYTSMGTSQMLSVPFALYAENAGSGEDNDWTENGNDLYNNNSGNVGIGTTTPGAKLEVAGHISQTGTGKSVFIGEQAGLNDDLSDKGNTFIGYKSGIMNTTGFKNVYIGGESGLKNETGKNNTMVGYWSGSQGESGSYNTYLGSNTASNSTASYNTYIGYASGNNTNTGSGNSYLGSACGFNNESGSYNSIIGDKAGYNIKTGSYNTYIGYQSGYSDTAGIHNIFIGNKSGYNEMGSNKLYIESSDADSANALIYGEFDNELLALNASVGIGTTTPDAELHVNGAMRLGTGVRDFEIIEVDPSYPDGWSPLIAYGGIGIGSNTHINRQMFMFTDGGTTYDNNIFTVATSDNDGVLWEADLVMTQKGNMGIGLTDPNRKLYIRNTVDSLSYPLKIENKHTVPNEAAVGILFSTGGSGSNDRGKGGLVYEYTSTWNRGDFHFLQDPDANYDNPDINDAVFTIRNNGNVGFGTTSPKKKLHNTGDYYGKGHLWLHSIGGDGSNGTAFIQARDDSGISDIDLQIRTQNAGSYVDAVKIDKAGNVGIGTDTPSEKLHVNGNLYVEGDITHATKTGYVSVSAAAFRSYYGNDNTKQYINTGEGVIPIISNPAYNYTAPVNLPHGATLQKVTYYWLDWSDAEATMTLYRNNFNITSSEMASVLSDGNTGEGNSFDDTINYSTIDNSQFSYYLHLHSAIAINSLGVVIEYTYTD